MYTNFFFDCDGVILNSNKIKSEGFYFACKEFGHDKATKLEVYHKLNGGISRNEKFKYFINSILEIPFTDTLYKRLLEKYSKFLEDKLLKCESASNLTNIRSNFSNTNWFIVSGGNQSELRSLFKKRNLDNLFNGGIFGSPLDKFEIFKKLFKSDLSKKYSIYLGDSLYDYQVASQIGIDFRYISEWSEFKDLKLHSKNNNIMVHNNIHNFFSSFQGGEPESHIS